MAIFAPPPHFALGDSRSWLTPTYLSVLIQTKTHQQLDSGAVGSRRRSNDGADGDDGGEGSGSGSGGALPDDAFYADYLQHVGQEATMFERFKTRVFCHWAGLFECRCRPFLAAARERLQLRRRRAAAATTAQLNIESVSRTARSGQAGCRHARLGLLWTGLRG